MEGGTKVSSLTWNELLDAGNCMQGSMNTSVNYQIRLVYND